MNHSVKTASITLFFISTLFSGNIEKDLQTPFILAEPGDTITIPKGVHHIRGTLSIEGKDKNIVLEKFTVQDSKGDAIKAQYVDGIVFRSVKTEWAGGPKETNGAYGLYPVQCTNVLIEFSVAIGASDAGII
jgi:hypothetical protein